MPSKPVTTPRKLPRQDRSRVTVEAILEATARILVEEGYDRANTNRIAERDLSSKHRSDGVHFESDC